MTSLSTCFVSSRPPLSFPYLSSPFPHLFPSHSPSTFAAPVFVCLFSLVIVFYAAFDVVDGSADSSAREGKGAKEEAEGEGEECVLQLILISVGRSPLGLVIMTCKYKMPCQAVPHRLLRMQRMYLRIVGFSCCCCCTVEVVVAAASQLSLLWFCLRITSINFAGLICVLLPVALPAPHRSREALQANRAPRRPFVYAFSSSFSFIIFLLLFLFPLPTASATATCKRQQHHEKCIFNSRRDNVEDVVEKRQQQQQQ